MAEMSRDEELKRIRKEYPLLYPITLVVLVVIILLLAGKVIYSTPEADQAWGYGVNVFTSVISTIVTVGIIEVFNRRRARRESEEALKRQLVMDAASLVNDVARNAIHQIRREEWLSGATGLLKGADLMNANLRGADFSFANLQDANLRGADLRDTQWTGTQLQGARLDGANLEGVNLMGGTLTGTFLINTNLRSADLRGARLQGQLLVGADLRGANLRHARFQGADLSGARLEGVDLWQTRLQGADLSMAMLYGLDLSGAIFDETTILPDSTPWAPSYWTPEKDMRRFTGYGDPRRVEE